MLESAFSEFDNSQNLKPHKSIWVKSRF